MRLLKANEIECRVGQFTKNKDKYSVLLYKTARCDMAILDEVFGMNNWQVEYQMVGSQMFCTIKVWDSEKQQWISKQSNGTESNMEAEKGQASDALKRAGFMLGIGRELYTAPRIWISADINQYDLSVKEIEYSDNREINRLVIESDGQVVYEFPKGKSYSKPKETKPEPKAEPKVEDSEEWRGFWNKLQELCPDRTRLNGYCKEQGLKSTADITRFRFEQIKKRIIEDDTSVASA